MDEEGLNELCCMVSNPPTDTHLPCLQLGRLRGGGLDGGGDDGGLDLLLLGLVGDGDPERCQRIDTIPDGGRKGVTSREKSEREREREDRGAVNTTLHFILLQTTATQWLLNVLAKFRVSSKMIHLIK